MTPPGSLPSTPPAFSPLSPVTPEPDHAMVFGFPSSLGTPPQMFLPRHTVMPSHHQCHHLLEEKRKPATQFVGVENNPLSPLSPVNVFMDRRWGTGPSPGTGLNPMEQDNRRALLQYAAGKNELEG